MATKHDNPENFSAEELLYPDMPAMIDKIAITKQQLKNGELKCELLAVTNVPNLAALTPEAWTDALFGFLLEMHRGDYEHFRTSCTSAVLRIKDALTRAEAGTH